MDQDQEIIDYALSRNPNVDPESIRSKIAIVRQSNPGVSNQQIIQSITAHADNMDAKRSNMVKDSVLTKYADSFSPEARAKLVKANEEAASPIAAAISGFGAGLRGKSQSEAYNSAMTAAQANTKDALDQFDLGKKSSREDYAFDQQQRKDAQDTEMYGINKTRGDFDFQQKQTKAGREEADYALEQEKKARELDPSSEESKIAQSLAKEMMPSQDFSKVPAARLKELLPTIVKKYDIQTEKQNKAIAAQDRAIAAQDRKTLAEEKVKAIAAEKTRPSDKQIEVFTDFETATSDLNNLLASLGNKSEWTGAIDAQIPDMLVGDDQVAWRSAVGKYKDAYRKAITGAGAGPNEIAILETRLPTASDTLANFKAKSNEALRELQRRREIYASNLEKGGKDVSKFKTDRYPLKLRKDGNTATISSEQEERDARSKGWN